MTTVAFDGYTLAADSLVTSQNTRVGQMDKLWRWKHGWFSVSGRLEHYRIIRDFLNNGKKSKCLGKFSCLAWNEDEQVMYEAVNDFAFYPAPCPDAIGSGEQIALTALHMGKTAKQAIELAIKLDTSTGGPAKKVTLRKRADGEYPFNYSR